MSAPKPGIRGAFGVETSLCRSAGPFLRAKTTMICLYNICFDVFFFCVCVCFLLISFSRSFFRLVQHVFEVIVR